MYRHHHHGISFQFPGHVRHSKVHDPHFPGKPCMRWYMIWGPIKIDILIFLENLLSCYKDRYLFTWNIETKEKKQTGVENSTLKQRTRSPTLTLSHSEWFRGIERSRNAVLTFTHSSSSLPKPENLTRTTCSHTQGKKMDLNSIIMNPKGNKKSNKSFSQWLF